MIRVPLPVLSLCFALTTWAALPAPAAAQSDFTTLDHIGLFEDIAADTVTSNLFNHYAPAPQVTFTVVDPVPGLDLTGETHCLTVLDADNDGLLDVLKCDAAYPGEMPSRLLMGRGDGTFADDGLAGLPPQLRGAVAADLDNDGWTDLAAMVLRGGWRNRTWEAASIGNELPPPRLCILRNDGGRRWLDVSAAWLGSDGIVCRSLALADLDRDGWLDLVTTSGTAHGSIQVDTYYGSAAGFARRARCEPAEPWNLDMHPVYAQPLVSVFDVDGDGDQDVLLQGAIMLSPESRRLDLARNEGGRLTPPTPFPVPVFPRLSSLSWVDVDLDGVCEAYAGVSDYAGGRIQLLYAGPDGAYTDRGREMGLWAGYNVSAGGSWADWNADGYLDLLQVRHFNESAYTESALFLNDGGRRFINVTDRADAPLGPGSNAAVALDADGDGDQDLVLSHMTHYLDRMPIERTSMQLLRNDGESGHWLEIDLVGTASNRSALGASVTLYAGGRTLLRHPGGGAFWGSCHPPLRLHFGLADAARADSVVVRWPNGLSERRGPFTADQRLTFTEGEGGTRPGR